MLVQEKARVQHTGRIEEGVPVHDAVPHELGVFEAGDHAEHPLLLAPLQIRLEADDVVQRPLLVLGAELDVRPGAVAGVGVHQTHRAQRAEPHGVGTAGRHDLDGHTALVDRDGVGLFAVGIRVGRGSLLGTGVKIVERGALGRRQRCMERLVLGLVERTVQIVGLAPVVAGRGEDPVVVQALGRDDGGHSIVEMQPLVAGQAADLVGQRTVGQRAGGHQDGSALVDLLHPLPPDGDVRALLHPAGDGSAEGVAVHSQRAAGGHAGLLGGSQQLAAHPAHLLFQQAGSGIQPLSFQAVGADQLCKTFALVGRGKVGGLLLIERDVHALARQPERRLAARQTGT